ncbi:protein NRT1/ PTR FAMILY 4.5-like [Carex rostrata]
MHSRLYTIGLFLNKASIYTGDTEAWSYCDISQVEEAKLFVKMLPVFISSIFCYLPFSFFFTLTAPAASTMNTKIMGVKIAPASLYAVAVVIQFIVLVMYNLFITPVMQRYTSSRYYNTTSHLVRAGVGFVFAMLGTGVATLVERKRRIAEDPKDLSFLWSLLQFICVGLMEVLSFVGLMEFFSNQLPVKLKSLSSSMVFCIVGTAIWLDGALVAIIGRVTRHGDEENGWNMLVFLVVVGITLDYIWSMEDLLFNHKEQIYANKKNNAYSFLGVPMTHGDVILNGTIPTYSYASILPVPTWY